MSHLPEVANPDCGFFPNFSILRGQTAAAFRKRCTVVRRKHAGTYKCPVDISRYEGSHSTLSKLTLE